LFSCLRLAVDEFGHATVPATKSTSGAAISVAPKRHSIKCRLPGPHVPWTNGRQQIFEVKGNWRLPGRRVLHPTCH
jgi:hypothetical protein